MKRQFFKIFWNITLMAFIASCAMAPNDRIKTGNGEDIPAFAATQNPGTIVHAWCRGMSGTRPINFIVRSSPPATSLVTQITLEKTTTLPEENQYLNTTVSQLNAVRTYTAIGANATIDLGAQNALKKYDGTATNSSSASIPVQCRVPSLTLN